MFENGWVLFVVLIFRAIPEPRWDFILKVLWKISDDFCLLKKVLNQEFLSSTSYDL